MLMFSISIKCFIEKKSKIVKSFRVKTIKCLNVFISEFEGKILLKFNSFSWHIRHEKSIVNMKQASITFYHDISIVSIFYLKEVCYQAISDKRIQEIFLSIFSVEDRTEVDSFFSHLINRNSIFNTLNNSGLM